MERELSRDHGLRRGGAPPMFSPHLYPRDPNPLTMDEVQAEQERILAESMPIVSMATIQGQTVKRTDILEMLYAPVEILVRSANHPAGEALRTILAAQRAIDKPLELPIFSQWSISRSEKYLHAILSMRLEMGAVAAEFNMVFDIKDAKARTMLAQIEDTRVIILDDVDSPLPPPNARRIAPLPTTVEDLITGQARFGIVERMRGITLQIVSSIENAFSHDEIFSLAFKAHDGLAAAWPRVLHLDRSISNAHHKRPIEEPPLDRHTSLASAKFIHLDVTYSSWFGSPLVEGFSMGTALRIGKGISTQAQKRLQPGWSQLAVCALNVEWTAGALPVWEIVLTWRNGHDPWHELLHAMRLSDPIPFDLTPMIFFLAQHALLPDGGQRAQAWAPHVQFYELGMMNLVMALIHEWSAVDEARPHIEAISQFVLDPELARKAGICRTLLLALDADLSALHATDADGLDVELLKTFAQLGRLVWSTRMGSTIVGGLLRHPYVDTVALAGIGMLDALLMSAMWQQDPPNPLGISITTIDLLPFLWYQWQMINRYLPGDCGRNDIQYLVFDLLESFESIPVPFGKRVLPWSGYDRGNESDEERNQQIAAAVFWYLDQVRKAEEAGRARPAAGRFELPVPAGFYDMEAYGVERLRIAAFEDGLLVRLILKDTLGGLVVPWYPHSEWPQHWRMLIPEEVCWQLHLARGAIWRDMWVAGREKVIIGVQHDRPRKAPASQQQMPRGRAPGRADFPSHPVERIRIGRGAGPTPRVQHVEWTTLEERTYIQKRKHGVRGRFVKLPSHWKASQIQRDLVQSLGLPELPEYGMTYRRPHTRGTDTPETKARPVLAQGPLIAMGVLDSLRQDKHMEEAHD